MDENISWFTQAPQINYFLAFSREKKSFEGSITPKVSLQIWVNLGVGTSSETQGQIVGTRESLNGRKNMARRKVKNGEKSPWGQCLTRPVPTAAAVLASDWCQKNTSFLAPIRSQNGGDRWNWSGKTLSPGAPLAVLYFSSCHIFPPV